MADLAWQQQYVTAPNTVDTEVYYHLANGKQAMDEIRANLNAMQSEEDRLLTERVQEINAAFGSATIWLLFLHYLSDWGHASLLGIFL